MNLEKHITKPFAIVLDKKGGIKKEPTEKDTQLWLNLDYKNQNTPMILEKEYNLDSYAINILISENAHQRITHLDNDKGSIIVLKKSSIYNPKKSSSLRILIRENQIITLSHNQSQSTLKTYEKLEKSVGPKDTIECLISIIQNLFSSIYEKTTKITNNLDEIEELIISNKKKKDLHIKILNIRKEIIDTHKYLVPQKDIFDNILGEIPFITKSKYKNYFTEINNNISKAIDSLTFSREHILILQEEIDNSMNISMNNHMYILSVIVTIFTPLTVISGMLGMNVKGIPYSDNEYAFAGVCTIMLLIALISLLLLKKIRKS